MIGSVVQKALALVHLKRVSYKLKSLQVGSHDIGELSLDVDDELESLLKYPDINHQYIEY